MNYTQVSTEAEKNLKHRLSMEKMVDNISILHCDIISSKYEYLQLEDFKHQQELYAVRTVAPKQDATIQQDMASDIKHLTVLRCCCYYYYSSK